MASPSQLYKDLMAETLDTVKKMVDDPAQKATIYSNILISLAIVMSANKQTSTTTEQEQVTTPVTTGYVAEQPVHDTSTENTETEDAKLEEDFDKTWTPRMKDKFQFVIDYITDAVNEYGLSDINDFIQDTTDNEYAICKPNDPESMIDLTNIPPAPLYSIYTLMKKLIEASQSEE